MRRLARRLRNTPFYPALTRAESRLAAALPSYLTKATAAHALAVSTTALDRWLERGAIPAIDRRPGRPERIDTAPLLDLVERVEILRGRGRRERLLQEALRGLGRLPARPR